MDISTVECFLEVARYGSTTAAADTLFLTQSSVSRKIQALERFCGTALFHRSKKGMSLTPAGSALLPIANKMTVGNAEWWRAISDVHQSEVMLRVACPTMVAESLILPFVASGIGQIFDVVEVPTVNIYDSVASHSADLAIAPLVPPVSLATRCLFKLPFTLQVPRDHEFAARKSVEIRELEDTPLLMSDLRSGARRSFELLLAGSGIVFRHMRSVSRTHIAQALTSAGLGLTVSIDPPKYDLASLDLLHEGNKIYCDEWAAWHPDHFAVDAIKQTLDAYVGWSRAQPQITELAEDAS